MAVSYSTGPAKTPPGCPPIPAVTGYSGNSPGLSLTGFSPKNPASCAPQVCPDDTLALGVLLCYNDSEPHQPCPFSRYGANKHVVLAMETAVLYASPSSWAALLVDLSPSMDERWNKVSHSAGKAVKKNRNIGLWPAGSDNDI